MILQVIRSMGHMHKFQSNIDPVRLKGLVWTKSDRLVVGSEVDNADRQSRKQSR